MNIVVLNATLLIAWAMVFAGAVLFAGWGLGLVAGGVALVALTFLAARAVGGFYGGRAGTP